MSYLTLYMVFFSVLSENITQNTATTKIQLLNNINYFFYYLPKTWPQNRKQKMNIRLKTHVYIYDLKKNDIHFIDIFMHINQL